MGTIRNIAILVLSISFVVFVALFGRLPIFRKTPIGFLHRLIWIHTPNFLQAIDNRLTGGRVSRWLSRTGNYLMNEPHPIVLIFFLLLLSISQVLFVPAAWQRISIGHQLIMVVMILLPYLFIYLSVTSDSSIITTSNHDQNMHLYPYDYAIFHPGTTCRTCHFVKPARSKHCSICKACIARQDHHCIWLNNCVGRANYSSFLNLLLSLSIMLAYGVYLGHGILDQSIQSQAMIWRPSLASSNQHWSKGKAWSYRLHIWSLAITDDARLGGVTLLCLLSAPLTLGLFVYHLYLIWTGMTTNESVKWADWRDDITDGVAFKGKRSDLRAAGLMKGGLPPKVDWPVESDQVLVRTEDGNEPGKGHREGLQDLDNTVPSGHPPVTWKRVKSLQEVDNLYDLGFWENLIRSFAG